jgi:hypothetical protein
MSISLRLPAAALDLRDFLRRGQVLAQYRSFQRELARMPRRSAARLEIGAQVRAAFKANKAERDRANVRAMLTEGTRQLHFLRTYAGTARRGEQPAQTVEVRARADGAHGAHAGDGHAHGGHAHGGHARPAEAAPPAESAAAQVAAVFGAPAPAGSQPAAGSWVGTGDKDDIRGRAGEGWPWQR